MSRYSNFVPRLISLKPEWLNSSLSNASAPLATDLTDTSYDPNCIITEIEQQQKDLMDDEILLIVKRYMEGARIYELAREFGCHRGTISRHLKQQGVKVSNKVTDRPALVERVLRMYDGGMKPKDIGAELGINARSVLNVLHEHNVRIRHSSEYAKIN